MSSKSSSSDCGYTQFTDFNERLPTLRYQHAVVFCGQKILHLIMRTLICGDINNVKACVKNLLKTNTQYKNSFTKEEQLRLEKGDHIKWDISLLFKMIQKVCGLAPSGDSSWTQSTGGDETLEYLITCLKDHRNELVHDFEFIIPEDQLEEHLNELTDLSSKIISALVKHASELSTQLYVIQNGKQLSDIDSESTETFDVVLRIIENVKEKIDRKSTTSTSTPDTTSVEVVDDSDEEDDYNSNILKCDRISQMTGLEQLPQESSVEDIYKYLMSQFWKYAGPKDAVF